MWSHLSPLKCAEVTNGCSDHQQRKYGRLIQQNQLKRKASGEANELVVHAFKAQRANIISTVLFVCAFNSISHLFKAFE